MAQLDVEPKKNNDWWKWLLGILAAVILIWVIVDSTDDDTVDTDDQQITPADTTRTTSLEGSNEYNGVAIYHRV